jgi:Protein of unknown function (DUF2505)
VEFTIVHDFAAEPDRVAAALLDLDYQSSLDGVGPLKERSVLDQDSNDDGRVTRRIRCVLDIEISGPAKSFVGDGPPAWVEVATWEPDDMSWSWEIVPEIAAHLLSASGSIRLTTNTDNTTRRSVSGDVRVKVPFYGGKVEGWIVDGLERAYNEEARRLEAWLES